VRTPVERDGDLKAQLAANHRGIIRLDELITRYGEDMVSKYSSELIHYAERMTRKLLQVMPKGEYEFVDYMDNDGVNKEKIPIKVKITITDSKAVVDFNGSAPQQEGSINAVYAITLSAVYYVFRCLLGIDVPNNSGCLKPIEVITPEGSIVNAQHPAPVAGGNVETSQRITDVLLGALSKALHERIPAASQGTMNNTLIGGWDEKRNRPFTYYETIGGGTGAGSNHSGVSAIHSHMTNTLNTPIEALEFSYPFQVRCYEIIDNTGGKGKYYGGNGIQRDIELLNPAQVSLLSDRRETKPYGLAGGEPGACGKNILIRDGKERSLPGKGSVDLQTGDILSIRTPGGGGFGKSE
jgi:N-methylhydantoinase B